MCDRLIIFNKRIVKLNSWITTRPYVYVDKDAQESGVEELALVVSAHIIAPRRTYAPCGQFVKQTIFITTHDQKYTSLSNSNQSIGNKNSNYNNNNNTCVWTIKYDSWCVPRASSVLLILATSVVFLSHSCWFILLLFIQQPQQKIHKYGNFVCHTVLNIYADN